MTMSFLRLLGVALVPALGGATSALHAHDAAPAAQSPGTQTAIAATAPVQLALRCGRLFDARAGALTGASTVVVQAGRIAAVLPGAADVPGATIVDLAAHTCMPGWIDMHVHLSVQIDGRTTDALLRHDPADFALIGAHFARRTLLAGFTTVRNLGDVDDESIALRDAVDKGLLDGPRIFSAGRLIGSTGSHADISNGFNKRFVGDPGPAEGIVNSADDAYKAVRQRYKDGADLIKITATGGVLSLGRNGQNPQMREQEIAAVVAAAHEYGFKVAAHAHGSDGIKRAVRAGVDSIEHGSHLDDETLALMKRRGTWYVPTVAAGAYVAEQAAVPGFYPEVIRPKAAALGPLARQVLARAAAAGVPIAFGSDAGAIPHGDNAREFVEMVAAGLSPARALQAATVDAATLLGQSETLGTLEAGKFADIVAVPGDPLADITLTRRPSFVMKAGRIHRTPD